MRTPSKWAQEPRSSAENEAISVPRQLWQSDLTRFLLTNAIAKGVAETVGAGLFRPLSGLSFGAEAAA